MSQTQAACSQDHPFQNLTPLTTCPVGYLLMGRGLHTAPALEPSDLGGGGVGAVVSFILKLGGGGLAPAPLGGIPRCLGPEGSLEQFQGHLGRWMDPRLQSPPSPPWAQHLPHLS